MRLLVLLALMSFGASACSNTMAGAGEDISRAGDKIQETFE